MKNLLLIILLLPNIALADCDWTKIKKDPILNTYIYPEDLHLCVGSLVQKNGTLSLQVGDLTQAISLKDLALQKSDERVKLWSDTAQNLEVRLQKVDSMQSSNNWLSFGLGCLTVLASGYMVSKLVK